MGDLDSKLAEIIDACSDPECGLCAPRIAKIKQAFIADGYEKPLIRSIARDELGSLMTGQEWFDKFKKTLYVPPTQEYPGIDGSDDGEAHDRFFRVGGMNFMYGAAIKAAKKASNLDG